MSGVVLSGYVDLQMFFRRTNDPEDYMVSIGFTVDVGAWSFADSGTLKGFIETEPLILAVISNQQRFSRFRFRVGTTGDPIIHELGSVAVGTSTADVAPPQVAGLWRKNTAVGGRRNRGRLYWPSVPEAAIDPVGVLTTAQRQAQQNAANALFNYLNSTSTNTAGAVLFHSTGPFAPEPLTGITVDETVATQRRRLRR